MGTCRQISLVNGIYSAAGSISDGDGYVCRISQGYFDVGIVYSRVRVVTVESKVVLSNTFKTFCDVCCNNREDEKFCCQTEIKTIV